MLDVSAAAENKKILIFLSGKFKQQIVLQAQNSVLFLLFFHYKIKS